MPSDEPRSLALEPKTREMIIEVLDRGLLEPSRMLGLILSRINAETTVGDCGCIKNCGCKSDCPCFSKCRGDLPVVQRPPIARERRSRKG